MIICGSACISKEKRTRSSADTSDQVWQLADTSIRLISIAAANSRFYWPFAAALGCIFLPMGNPHKPPSSGLTPSPWMCQPQRPRPRSSRLSCADFFGTSSTNILECWSVGVWPRLKLKCRAYRIDLDGHMSRRHRKIGILGSLSQIRLFHIREARTGALPWERRLQLCCVLHPLYLSLPTLCSMGHPHSGITI